MKKLSLVISAALLSSSLALTSPATMAAWPSSVDGQTMPSLAPMLEEATPAVVSIAVKGTHEIKQNVPTYTISDFADLCEESDLDGEA